MNRSPSTGSRIGLCAALIAAIAFCPGCPTGPKTITFTAAEAQKLHLDGGAGKYESGQRVWLTEKDAARAGFDAGPGVYYGKYDGRVFIPARRLGDAPQTNGRNNGGRSVQPSSRSTRPGSGSTCRCRGGCP